MKLVDMLVEDGLNGWQWPDGATKATSYSHIPGVHFWDYDGFRVDYSDLTTRELGCEEVTREQYESALAAKNKGWIEWGGGECPVQTGVLVDVRYDDGVEEFALEANMPNKTRFRTAAAAWWRKDGSSGDIIAYRLHKQQEAEQAEADDGADMDERIVKNDAAVWNGEGFPPVGCFCEVEDLDGMLVYGQGESGEVIAHVENTAVIRMSYGLGCFEARFLRPLRTEADKKRDAAINAIKESYYKQDRSGNYRGEEGVFDDIAAGKIPGVKLED